MRTSTVLFSLVYHSFREGLEPVGPTDTNFALLVQSHNILNNGTPPPPSKHESLSQCWVGIEDIKPTFGQRLVFEGGGGAADPMVSTSSTTMAQRLNQHWCTVWCSLCVKIICHEFYAPSKFALYRDQIYPLTWLRHGKLGTLINMINRKSCLYVLVAAVRSLRKKHTNSLMAFAVDGW